MTSERWIALDVDECASLLATQDIGRLAFVDDGLPVILPVNFVLDGSRVIFRTASGSAFKAAVERAPAAFEVDCIEPSTRTGWSVLVRGYVECIDDPDEAFRLTHLPLAAWPPDPKPNYVRMCPMATTGRRISPPEAPYYYYA